MREIHKTLLSASGVVDPTRYLSPEKQPAPQDPVSDILAASKGMPISAFPGQDHKSYITVFSSFINDPSLGKTPALQHIVPILQAGINEHMLMQYQETMGGAVQQAGNVDPGVMPQIMAEAAEQILNANQQLGQYQTLEQQQLMLESKSLELKERGLTQSNAKDMADLALKKQELDLRKRGQDIDAAGDIGTNTIKNKEAENKKEIMLQKFLLEGLNKMKSLKGGDPKGDAGVVNFAEGGEASFAEGFDTEKVLGNLDISPSPRTAASPIPLTTLFNNLVNSTETPFRERISGQEVQVADLSSDSTTSMTDSAKRLFDRLVDTPMVKPAPPLSESEISSNLVDNPAMSDQQQAAYLNLLAEGEDPQTAAVLSVEPTPEPMVEHTMSLMDRMIWQESKNDPNAESDVGAAGLMQIMEPTAGKPGFGVTPMDWEKDRFDPVENRRFGTEYMDAMLERYNGDVELALIAYNAGYTRADAFVEAGRDYEPFRGYTESDGTKVHGWADEAEEYVSNIMGEQTIDELPPLEEN
tara:strand:- start:2165 stop:3745 length:1581 start_codon:yes stop_codon:yes gene_type:complete